MKNYTTIIIVFSFLLVGVAGVAIGWKFLEGEQARKAEEQYQQYVQKYKTQEATAKRSVSLSATPAPQAITASGLNKDLQGVTDDGGKSDFDQLQKDISGL